MDGVIVAEGDFTAALVDHAEVDPAQHAVRTVMALMLAVFVSYTLGYRTRTKHKSSDKFIIRGRKRGKRG